jgi:hypothetical protein
MEEAKDSSPDILHGDNGSEGFRYLLRPYLKRF